MVLKPQWDCPWDIMPVWRDIFDCQDELGPSVLALGKLRQENYELKAARVPDSKN